MISMDTWFDEQSIWLRKKTLAYMYKASCDLCNKPLELYLNDHDVDGSVTLFCVECYEKQKKKLGGYASNLFG
jgi:hypothetical protein